MIKPGLQRPHNTCQHVLEKGESSHGTFATLSNKLVTDWQIFEKFIGFFKLFIL